MNFNFTNTIKNKINNLQKANQKKTLKIKDIVLLPEFEKMLAMDESVINAMTESMKAEGFKPGHELHVWSHDGKYILIDGHTRRYCAIKAGLISVPCIVHHFETFEEAKQFALREQTDRRNLSDQEIARIYMELAELKGPDGKKAKSDAEIAAELQVSPRQIAKIKEVERKASAETLEAFKDGKISLNMAYNETKKELSAQKEEVASPEKKTETVSSEKKEEPVSKPKIKEQKQKTEEKFSDRSRSLEQEGFRTGLLYIKKELALGKTLDEVLNDEKLHHLNIKTSDFGTNEESLLSEILKESKVFKNVKETA
ncbi:ParB/RepB/Spo0J family partition protein [Treponema sp.]|uniref:ParB/RepB/Spo0J family partition protein n=1 Tax=Treponema sp. TaxID=166 RepID=UPI00388DA640